MSEIHTRASVYALPVLASAPGPERGPLLDLVLLGAVNGTGAQVGATPAEAWEHRIATEERYAAGMTPGDLAEFEVSSAEEVTLELLQDWVADELPSEGISVRVSGRELDVWRLWSILNGAVAPSLDEWRRMVPYTGEGPDVVAHALARDEARDAEIVAEREATANVPAPSPARAWTPEVRAFNRCLISVTEAMKNRDLDELNALAEHIERFAGRSSEGGGSLADHDGDAVSA